MVNYNVMCFHFQLHSAALCVQQKAHLSVVFQSWTAASLWNQLWNGLIDGATEPGRVRHKVIKLDVQHCWVYKQPNSIQSPCSAALSRKLLRLKSVFLEARYCINLWWKKERKSQFIWCCSMTTATHVHSGTITAWRWRVCLWTGVAAFRAFHKELVDLKVMN